MEEILVKFHPICSLDQLIVDLEIELEHTLKIDRFIMLIINLPTWTQQTFTRFGDWIYPPMHACSAFNVNPFMEPTRYFKKLSIFHKHKNRRWLWRMKWNLGLLQNDTWDFINLPFESFIVSCKWVYKFNLKSNGNVQSEVLQN
jgi:hypothetical protein